MGGCVMGGLPITAGRCRAALQLVVKWCKGVRGQVGVVRARLSLQALPCAAAAWHFRVEGKGSGLVCDGRQGPPVAVMGGRARLSLWALRLGALRWWPGAADGWEIGGTGCRCRCSKAALQLGSTWWRATALGEWEMGATHVAAGTARQRCSWAVRGGGQGQWVEGPYVAAGAARRSCSSERLWVEVRGSGWVEMGGPAVALGAARRSCSCTCYGEREELVCERGGGGAGWMAAQLPESGWLAGDPG